MRSPLRSLSSGALLIVAALGVPYAAPAQTLLYTVSAGPSVGGPGAVTKNPGFDLQASVGRKYAADAAWRLDAFASVFEVNIPLRCAFCGPGLTQMTNTGVAGLVLSELLGARPEGPPMYLIAGVETDWLFRQPSALRLGLSVGWGIALAAEGRLPALVLEASYHHLIDGPAAATWFVPVTLGIRF